MDREKMMIYNEADQRSHELMHDLLTIEERLHMAEYGYLEVPSTRAPGRVYRISLLGDVSAYRNDSVIAHFCLITEEHLPSWDMLLLHKLLLEGAEELYIQQANCWLYQLGVADTDLYDKMITRYAQYRQYRQPVPYAHRA